jgi:predicted phage baseplate assembly protein
VLQEPLQHCYDPTTVTIHANVVAATHGETIADGLEVLGSGDGNLTNQKFLLKKPPLTYTATASAGRIASSLEIRVNGLLWREVLALYNLKPDDQVYIVRIEDDGTTSITFGDGINGARLPSGTDNVVAIYRSGIGLSGNVAAGKLSLLKNRPLGIQSVTNPLAAMGAANPETINEIRDRAPLTVRTLERVVSLRDFEDFTSTFPGISKAKAVQLWSAQVLAIHLTIAGNEGNEVSADTKLYQSLEAALEQVRDPYQPPPVMQSYESLWFALTATILVKARYQPDQVKAEVEDRLQQTFAFTNREFGQSVTTAEVIDTIQSVEGVAAVDLETLHLVNAPKTLEPHLTATLAYWNPESRQFAPAQLLLLHTATIALQFDSLSLSSQ